MAKYTRKSNFPFSPKICHSLGLFIILNRSLTSENNGIKYCFSCDSTVLGSKPRTVHIPNKLSTSEPQPQVLLCVPGLPETDNLLVFNSQVLGQETGVTMPNAG